MFSEVEALAVKFSYSGALVKIEEEEDSGLIERDPEAKTLPSKLVLALEFGGGEGRVLILLVLEDMRRF